MPLVKKKAESMPHHRFLNSVKLLILFLSLQEIEPPSKCRAECKNISWNYYELDCLFRDEDPKSNWMARKVSPIGVSGIFLYSQRNQRSSLIRICPTAAATRAKITRLPKILWVQNEWKDIFSKKQQLWWTFYASDFRFLEFSRHIPKTVKLSNRK